eukprot:2993703-Pyramimonas_sp.AAC.1
MPDVGRSIRRTGREQQEWQLLFFRPSISAAEGGDGGDGHDGGFRFGAGSGAMADGLFPVAHGAQRSGW